MGKEEEPMAEQMTVGGLDFGALRRAIEGRDAEALAGFYADDAQIRTVNKNAPPAPRRSCAARSTSPGTFATSADGR